MKEKIRNWITDTTSTLGIASESFVVEHPTDASHGDYATNVALTTGGNPKEQAERICAALQENILEEVESVSVAGPGFINITLADTFLHSALAGILKSGDAFGRNNTRAGTTVMVEYTDPNPFKQFHIGHLMTNTIGETLARILEFSGARVIRANYQGDVGPHVAKAIWGMQQLELPSENASLQEKAAFLGRAYVLGAKAYEEGAREEIEEINRALYAGTDETLNALYQAGRKWSLEHFEEIYQLLGTTFDYYFFESEVAPLGIETVRKFQKEGVFEESEGAVVYRGERDGLHTRVFITSQGLPTYEAKEVGLTLTKFEKEPELDRSIVVTASEQDDYMRVVRAALEKMYPDMASKMEHISHGMMSGAGGKKMSSRTGDVVTGESLLHDVTERAHKKIAASGKVETSVELAGDVAVAAVKYMILKQAIGRDIVYDPEAILSFEGDSGPYLQYTYARARSVLEKSGTDDIANGEVPGEVERLLYRFEEVVTESLSGTFSPQQIVTYLIQLAQAYNRYYATHKVIGDPNEAYRISVTRATTQVLKNGMQLLGVPVVERM